MIVEIVASSWNCPTFITPRYTADEVHAATEPLRARIAELEAEVKAATPIDRQVDRAGIGR